MNYHSEQNAAEIEATIKELEAIRPAIVQAKHLEAWVALYTQAILLKHVNWR